MAKTINLPEGFWARVEKTPTCWNWQCCKNKKNGYGTLTIRGKRHLAHRLSWEMTNGPIPDELFVLHRCDNKACVRTDHLFLGTILDNNMDKIAKGRDNVPRGEYHIRAKLSTEDVAFIRSSYSPARKNGKVLARHFGIDGSTLYSIIKKETWKGIGYAH